MAACNVRCILVAMVGVFALWFAASAHAEDSTAIDVTIKDHQFTPSEIHVPANKPATLNIKNEDSAAEEFDSSALKVEKVISGGQQGAVHLRPLKPGQYPFMGEYHSSTAKGVVIAE